MEHTFQEIDELLDLGLRLKMLRLQIGRFLLPGNLPNLKLPVPDPLLDPQTGAFQMSKLAEAL